jgi:hypothetical protein
MSITIKNFKKCVCDECGKECRGVEFQLLDDPQNVSFLCWFHWRANTEILLEAGLQIRAPRRPIRSRTTTDSESESWSDTEGRSYATGRSRTTGTSGSETHGQSCSRGDS